MRIKAGIVLSRPLQGSHPSHFLTPHLLICFDFFFSTSGQEVNVATCCHILSVVGDSAAHLNEDTRTRIVGECG